MLTTQRNTLAIAPDGTIVLFTEETKGRLYTDLMRKAAMATGIDAMVTRAIDTGDHNDLDMIQSAASDLADALKHLSQVIGQMQSPAKA